MEGAVSLHDVQSLLDHLHDPIGLDSHPLAQRLAPNGAVQEPLVRGQQLKALFIELIEGLKPTCEPALWNGEWRRYLVLHERYVRRRPLRELEEKLALSDRQVRRVHRQALAALAVLIGARLSQAVLANGEVPASTRLAAVGRLSPKPRTFELTAVLQRMAGTLGQLSLASAPRTVWHVWPEHLAVYADPGILHQLLVRLLQLAISHARAGRAPGDQQSSPDDRLFSLDAHTEASGQITIALVASATAIEETDEELLLCRALAACLGAELSLYGGSGDDCQIVLALPRSVQARRVLIIDDDPPAIELFSSYLRGLDYQVIGETSAEQALQRAAELQPAAIVLDVMMPGMDGWELLQRLRHDPQLQDVPIIACSVLNDVGLAFALGASRFLKKPVLRQHLLAALAELCGPRTVPA